MILLSSIIFMVIAAVVALSISIQTIGVNIPENMRLITWLVLGILVAFGGIASQENTFYVEISQFFLVPTLGSLSKLPLPGTEYDVSILSVLRLLFKLGNVVAIIGSILIAYASSVTIVKPADQERFSVEQIADRYRQLRNIAYSGAALLIAGVFTLYSWMIWPIALLNPNDELGKRAIAEIEHLALGSAIGYGMAFTALLIAAYFPIFVELRREALSLAREKQREKSVSELEKWLAVKGMDISFIKQANLLMFMFGPVLTGPLGEAVQSILAA